MQEPKKPDGPKGRNLDDYDVTRELIKCVAKPDPEPVGRKMGKALRRGTDKVSAFFNKAKAALNGDAAAQEEISDAAANKVINTANTIETAGKATSDFFDKTEKKITEGLDKKAKPPSP